VSRIGFAMGRDGLLPPAVAKVSPRTGTPMRLTLIYAGAVFLLASFVKLTTLADLVSIGTLFAFVLVSLAVPVLRRRRPQLRRPAAALLLGGVHRLVGPLHQRGDVAARLRPGDPDAGRDVDLLTGDDRRGGERLAHPVPHGQRGVRRAEPPADDEELVAADPPDDVLPAQHRRQPLRGQREQLVAGVVAQGVVDRLEPVEVDE